MKRFLTSGIVRKNIDITPTHKPPIEAPKHARLEQIIAVDFDGCLCENAYPKIGAPHLPIITELLRRQAHGARLILWTCRVGDKLFEAEQWCSDQGLVFDAVNENLPEMVEAFGNDCRKVYADEYWDDRAVRTMGNRGVSCL